LKYWTRRPYLGFGVDAHSMLQVQGEIEAVRFSTPILWRLCAGDAFDADSRIATRGTGRKRFFSACG